MVTTRVIITQMNAFNVEEEQRVEEGVRTEVESKVKEGTQRYPDGPSGSTAVEKESGEAIKSSNEETKQDNCPELVPQDDQESLAEEETDNESEDNNPTG